VEQPKPARRTNAERRATAKRKILDAAMASVAERGLEGFTLEQVGKAAGVSRALAAYHFGNKEGLVAGLIEWLFNAVGVDDLARSGERGLEPLLDAMGASFDTLMKAPVACRALSVLQGYALSNPSIAAKLIEVNAGALGAIESHLVAGLAAGEVSGAVHAKNHAFVILAGVRAVVAAYQLQPGAMSVDELRLAFMGSLRRVLAEPAR
jgi:AcrR family transcriptional regulator